MGKIQKRRSISMRGDTYEALKRHCNRLGISMSGWLEQTIGTKVQEERDRYGEGDARGTKETGV